MAALVALDLTLNEVLTKLGYRVVRHRQKTNGVRSRSVRKNGRAIRFAEGTLSGQYRYVTNLEFTNAGIVWAYLRATGEIQ
jgi:hypothetical protein